MDGDIKQIACVYKACLFKYYVHRNVSTRRRILYASLCIYLNYLQCLT